MESQGSRRDEFYDSFEKYYHCYSLTRVAKPQLEGSDKIVMPQSALDRLARTQVEYPMLFELCNLSSDQVTHCGVVEFTAEEGFVYLPDWMMKNMKLQEYELVKVKNVSLEKGTFMKLQPHTKEFLEISDPKAVLEKIFSKFSCATTGDTIMIMHDQRKFYVDILETRPCSAVSIIETDCEVDFAAPLDYKEPKKLVKKEPNCQVKEQSKEVANKEAGKFKAFSGKGRRLDSEES